MARYDLGLGGRWLERYDDLEVATRRAEQLAEGGEVVEVARYFLGLHAFVTAFPEYTRKALKARRGYPYVGDLWGFGVSNADDHQGHGGAPGAHGFGSHFHGGNGNGHSGDDGGSHGGGGHG